MREKVDRRTMLKTVGAATFTAALAGCAGDDDDGGNGNENGNGNGNGNGNDRGSLEVNVQLEDTNTNPNTGVQAANALVNAGVPFICGSASSGVNVPVSKQALIPNQVVGCSPSSTALSVTNLDDDDYIFRTAPSDILQGAVMAQVASERIGGNTASTLYVNNDYGQQLSNRFSNVFEDQYGGTVEDQIAYNQNEDSYTSVIQEALGVDVINIIGYPEDGNTLFRDYYSLSDGSEDIIVPDGLRDGDMQSQVGNPMENIIGTAPAAGGPAQEAFNSAFQDEYGESPGVFASQSYDSVAIGILANAAAGENSGTGVRDQIRNIANPGGMEVTPENFVEGVEAAANGENVNYQGASSDTNFNGAGDPANASYSLWEFDGDGGTANIETQSFEGDSPDGAGPSVDSMPGGFGRTIEVGILLPETGNLASVGEDMIRAAELPAMQVNNSSLSG
jgi:ABC-type branched-subunit amino acid transport system substrate-binding protein